MNSIKNLLPEGHIQTINAVETWEKAVNIASEPLITENLITQEYVDSMIKNIEKNGPYVVLSDYFALMHAQPGKGVNEQGLSLLVCNEAVDLVGKPVKIFLILAAKDNQSHLESLQDIMSIFMDDQKYRTILSGNRSKIVKLFNK